MSRTRGVASAAEATFGLRQGTDKERGVPKPAVYPLRHFRNPQKPPKLLAEGALDRLRFPQRPVVEVDQPQAPSIRIRKCSFQITRPKLIF